MRVFLTKNVFFPLADITRNRKVTHNFRELLKSQWYSLDQLYAIQNDRLKYIIKHSYDKVPFYKERIDKFGFDLNASNYLEELKKLPVLERTEVRNAFNNKSIFAANFSDYKTKESKTSGSSTGEPLSTMEDSLTGDLGRASFYRAFNWADWHLGERAIKLWGSRGSVSRAGKLANKVINWETYNAFSMDKTLYYGIYNLIKSGKLKHIYSYVSALLQFVDFLDREGLEVPPTIKSIMTSAEVLTEDARKRIQDKFKTKVFNGYACGEVNGIAYECECQDGLHISMERCIVEIVDDNGNLLPNGQYGRIAVTDFFNHAMPLIRYIDGDVSAIMDGTCKCGRNLIRLKEIVGRTSDVIDAINGKEVHSTFFHVILVPRLDWQLKYGLKKYQFVQESKDTLKVIMEFNDVPPSEEVEKMETIITNQMGPMKIIFSANNNDFEYSNSGKYRWTLNKTRGRK
ncbi:MAG TPA: hypothetical protein VN721_16030 [Flavipsychrobacter sp.]|nr:hypothetical protein [Flavipsychrobacter sp.]